MEYVIEIEEKGRFQWLSKFKLEGSIFPSKEWTTNIDNAIKFNYCRDANAIITMLKVNTPYGMTVAPLEDNNYRPFNIGVRHLVESGEASLFFKSSRAYYPARIVCWDRKGIYNDAFQLTPLVGLVKHPKEGEILFELTENGLAYSKEKGSHQALYFKFNKK